MATNIKKEWLHIDLNPDLPESECSAIRGRIEAMNGVELAGFAPEGCFTRNPHKLRVLFNQNSSVKQDVANIPGLKEWNLLRLVINRLKSAHFSSGHIPAA